MRRSGEVAPDHPIPASTQPAGRRVILTSGPVARHFRLAPSPGGHFLLDTTRHTNELRKPRETASAFKSWAGRTAVLAPGLIAASLIAVLAFFFRSLPLLSVISPMMLAMLIGMILNNVAGQPSWLKDGILFSQRRLLRLAIVLLGLQLTFAEVVTLGATGVVILAVTLASTFVFTLHAARFLRVEEKLAKLIAAGNSVCGASAVVAANAVVDGKEEAFDLPSWAPSPHCLSASLACSASSCSIEGLTAISGMLMSRHSRSACRCEPLHPGCAFWRFCVTTAG